MSKIDNRCAHCGGKFGLVSHSHFGQRFCRKGCKEKFVTKAARERMHFLKWFTGLAPLTSR